MLMHIYGIQKNSSEEPICLAGIEMQIQRTDLWTQQEKARVGQIERVALTHKHSMCCVLSCINRVQLFATLWTAARPAPLSIGFSRQAWNGWPCPPPGYLPDPEIKTVSYVSCIGRWVLYHQHHLGSSHRHYHV